jgi:hypothetical protein
MNQSLVRPCTRIVLERPYFYSSFEDRMISPKIGVFLS